MKKKTRKQKEKLEAKRRKITKSDISISPKIIDRQVTDLNAFVLDKKLISQDLIKTVWVTGIILLLLLLLGLLQKGII